MFEHIFDLTSHTDISVFYGVNNCNMQLLKNLHPNIRIVGRGHTIKINGREEEVEKLVSNIEKLEKYCLNNNDLTE